MNLRMSPSRAMPTFSITRADALFSTSHTGLDAAQRGLPEHDRDQRSCSFRHVAATPIASRENVTEIHPVNVRPQLGHAEHIAILLCCDHIGKGARRLPPVHAVCDERTGSVDRA